MTEAIAELTSKYPLVAICVESWLGKPDSRLLPSQQSDRSEAVCVSLYQGDELLRVALLTFTREDNRIVPGQWLDTAQGFQCVACEGGIYPDAHKEGRN